MVSFKYLANILQHSSLNDCFREDSENKTANVFSLIFAGFYCSYGDNQCEHTIVMTIKDENMRTINFILKLRN